eukprot:TRINITY_DN67145_c1_g1_i1.p1 TRINITY_DN67145_c1_g1~~TRINITY_DN67145_c1_g1_i1.p1  ORF type:complete len:284 (+),score=14.88 TRINITY_DN67145_c1_g1_i1:170-1021(+)
MSNIQLCAGVADNIGKRAVMEDEHHIVLDVSSECELSSFPHAPHAWFAIFDGHAGTDSAVNAKKCLLKEIVKNEHYAAGEYEKAITEGFCKTDEDFRQVCSETKQQGNWGFRSGCTAVTALIIGNRLLVGNLGDSRGVMCKGKEAVQLSEDHKPTREDETARIKAAGGHVLFNRVNGVLGVSRALGDFEFKEEGKSGHDLVISNKPDITEFTLDDETSFMILACDGLWDVVTNAEAVECVQKVLEDAGNRSEETLKLAAKILTDLAINKDSLDNVSVLVVSFH